MRTECTHCGAAIEFEEDDRGLERACANCGETTMLVEGLHHVASARPPRSAGARRAGVLGKLLLLVVLGGVLLFVGFAVGARSRTDRGSKATREPVRELADLVEVSEVKKAFHERDCVEGMVVNRASVPLARVAVYVNLYDASSNLVENASDAILNVMPGDRWKFRCLARGDFAHFRLISVRAE